MLQHTISKSVAMGLILLMGASTTPLQTSYASEWEGNARLLMGDKSLDSGDWTSLDSQNETGFLFDIKKDSWPVSIAFDVIGSAEDSAASDPTIENALTVEQHFGVRKYWGADDNQLHPYIGGGVAVIYAELEQRDSIGGAEDDDRAVGAWVGAGAYYDVTSHINVGIDVRYSRADVTVFNQDFDAGGVHAGLTLGYRW